MPEPMDADAPAASTSPRPPVSVVVPTRDRPDMLERCLGSLRAAAGADDELIVVDSASRWPEPVAELAGRFGARHLHCDLPGASRARNVGWRAAQHELIAFVDDDVWVDRLWADALARCAGADHGTAFVTGRIAAPPGQSSAHVATKDDPQPAVLDGATVGLMGHSASMVVRRAALDEVGGFDEALGAGAPFRGAEDADLFERLLASGHRGRYEPAALAWHDQWRGRAANVRLQYGYGVGTGAELAKLARLDRARARRLAGEHLWRWGLAELGRSVRRREKLGAAASAARLGGLLVGVARAAGRPVVGGHFALRARREPG